MGDEQARERKRRKWDQPGPASAQAALTTSPAALSFLAQVGASGRPGLGNVVTAVGGAGWITGQGVQKEAPPAVVPAIPTFNFTLPTVSKPAPINPLDPDAVARAQQQAAAIAAKLSGAVRSFTSLAEAWSGNMWLVHRGC
jgi:hypothetical protein